MLKVIPGTAGFLAGEDGTIYTPSGEKRNTYRNSDGYVTASVLTDDGRWVTYGVHRLVARAHLQESYTTDRCDVNHRDSNLENNEKSNLEWVTAGENNIHAEIMSECSDNPSIVALFNNSPKAWYCNAETAAVAHGLHKLQIWDSIKDNKSIGDWKFVFRRYSQNIPAVFKKYCFKSRDDKGRAVQRGIKTMNVDTGDIQFFASLAAAAKNFETVPSHIFQCIPKDHVVRLFRKQYQIAYSDTDFQEISHRDLELARSRGAKEVIAYNVRAKLLVFYPSATEFISSNNLSKKAVTVALAGNTFREIESWIAAYVTPENVEKIKTHMAVLATM